MFTFLVPEAVQWKDQWNRLHTKTSLLNGKHYLPSCLGKVSLIIFLKMGIIPLKTQLCTKFWHNPRDFTLTYLCLTNDFGGFHIRLASQSAGAVLCRGRITWVKSKSPHQTVLNKPHDGEWNFETGQRIRQAWPIKLKKLSSTTNLTFSIFLTQI